MRDTDFFITQLDDLKTDPVKSTMWRMLIPNTIWTTLAENGYRLSNFGDQFTSDDMKLHMRSITGLLPEFGATIDTLSYFGISKKFVTGVKDISGTVSCTAIMGEDMRALQALTYWSQTVAKGGILSEDNPAQDNDREKLTGLSKGLNGNAETGNRAVVNSDVRMQLYDFYAHEPIMTVQYVNAMCTGVKVPDTWTYEPAKLQTFDFTLDYDRPIVTFNERYR